ncbi:lipopolysaccharide biosynthesis protein [Mucilaginibacter sp.]|uniref:lipopolysaccharide biosynthesis protein n=1 Tax=Mucilaginibacter sp. TaxID=1882438 RepID=UPI0026198EA1|nr:lipopolysaccharide biosynthesis protein [Mucilaginibacter sp.]MDB4926314.1 lipopolysaccharide biosynthesis protein [Mucilaginibacter sp.]
MVKVDLEENLNNSEEITLKELILKMQEWWRYLLSKWVIILVAGIIGGAIGLTYAYFKKPIYTAELSFALQDEKSGGGLGSALGLASQFGIDLGGGGGGSEFSGDNLLQLMKSRTMVEKALLNPVVIEGKRETLAEYYIDCNKIREGWKGKPELENIHFLPDADRSKFTLKQDSILGAFHKTLITNNLTVDKVDKKLSIISLSVKSTNELFSKYFTEVLAKVVSDFYVQTKTEKSSKNVAILQRQTDSVRRALNGAISGVASSIDAAPNPNPALQTLHVPSQRRQVDVQANTAILGELVKNLEMAKMSLLQETPLIQVIDRPILPLEKERTGKLKGLIIGGAVAIFLTILAMSITKFFKAIML